MITTTHDYSVFADAASTLSRRWRKLPGVTAVNAVRNGRGSYRAGRETVRLVVSATAEGHAAITAIPDVVSVLHRGT